MFSIFSESRVALHEPAYLHTSGGVSGLAASSPLTWHAVIRFPRAGRDHVEDLGGLVV